MNGDALRRRFAGRGKEVRFAVAAGSVLLVAMMLPFTEVYFCSVALTVSAVVAMVMALFGVRLWVRLVTMPLVLLAALALTLAAHMAVNGIDTGSSDCDYDAALFSSRLLMHCPMIGSVTQTDEGRKAKVEFEKWGDRLDDMRILPWRSYAHRYRRCEILARIGAKFGLAAPLGIMAVHVLLAVWSVMTVWKLQGGVYRTVAGWVLAILILPWINTLFGVGVSDPNEDPLFVVPAYLPLVNESPELLLASAIQVGVLVMAVRCGRCCSVSDSDLLAAGGG